MDNETLHALIKLYRERFSIDLLSIIMDGAEDREGRTAVLDLLQSLATEFATNDAFASIRRKACKFCLDAEEFDLAERLARRSELPEDRIMRAQALFGLGRHQEAANLYRQAIQTDPAIRNREFERLLGIRVSGTLSVTPAKVIPLTGHSRREHKGAPESADFADAILDDFDETAVSFADVVGLDDIKAEIRRRIVLPYLKPSLFERYKQKAGGRLLLYGPPGCGKTLIAKASAVESDARFLSVHPEDILDKGGERRLRDLFAEAKSQMPAILFFDDFELVAAESAGNNSPVTAALTPVLLSELDEAGREPSGILVLAATRVPWIIDERVLRAGRFQRLMYVPPPSIEARTTILSAAVSGIPGHEKVLFDRVGRKTAGFSGADLHALADWACNKALTRALAGDTGAALTTALFEEGLKVFSPSARRWLAGAVTEIKARRHREILSRLFAPIFAR